VFPLLGTPGIHLCYRIQPLLLGRRRVLFPPGRLPPARALLWQH